MSFLDVVSPRPLRGIFPCSGGGHYGIATLALLFLAASCSEKSEQRAAEPEAVPAVANSPSQEPYPVAPGTPLLSPVQPAPSATVPDVAELIHEYPRELQAHEVMVDQTWVYWSNGDAMWRVKKDGSSSEREKVGPNGMHSLTMELAQDEQRVYWAYQPDNPQPEEPQRLVTVEKQTLEVSYIEYGNVDPRGGALLVDGGYAFVASASCRWLASIPLGGGEAQNWTVREGSLGGGDTSIAVDADYVYCGTGFAHSVYRVSRTDGSSVELVPPPADGRLRGVGGVAVDGRYVYWLETRSTPYDGPIHLFRQDKSEPGAGTSLIELPVGTLNDRLVLQGSTLYWTSGPLQRFNLEKGEYRYLWEQGGSDADLASDGDFIYWLYPGLVYRASIAALEAGGLPAPPESSQ